MYALANVSFICCLVIYYIDLTIVPFLGPPEQQMCPRQEYSALTTARLTQRVWLLQLPGKVSV
uniref:Uncharacterized protein n=1 Tax=Anguilla anguilla TaxID=7936 RepID=A0A0E9RZ35_ANGAN